MIMTTEERRNQLLEKILELKSNNISEDRIVDLEEGYNVLMECILELSEIIYA